MVSFFLQDTSELFPGPYKESTAGRAQHILGAWLAQQPRSLRDGLVLSVQVCGPSQTITWRRDDEEFSFIADKSTGTRVTKKEVIAAIDVARRRLGVDTVDLLQLQWPARYVPMLGDPRYERQLERESMTAFEQLQLMQECIQSGRIRAFGLSNETPYGVGLFTSTAQLCSLPCKFLLPQYH
jgi:aryl-alcohol dehydrogenase-like predicted oxidoreductase